MSSRHPNHRLVKIHRNYSVEQIAVLLGKHRNTARHWIKNGLPTIDGRRPWLIHGQDLFAFLKAKRVKNKRPCQPGEIYCVRCRVPKIPYGDMVDYQPITPDLGNLMGICPSCDAKIYRRVNRAKLEQVCSKLEVTFPQAL